MLLLNLDEPVFTSLWQNSSKNLQSNRNREREFAGFNALNAANLTPSTKTLITYDMSDAAGEIQIIPFWNFFGI